MYLQCCSINRSRRNNPIPIHSLLHEVCDVNTEDCRTTKRWDGTEGSREAIRHECKEIVGYGRGRRGGFGEEVVPEALALLVARGWPTPAR